MAKKRTKPDTFQKARTNAKRRANRAFAQDETKFKIYFKRTVVESSSIVVKADDLEAAREKACKSLEKDPNAFVWNTLDESVTAHLDLEGIPL